MWNGFYWVKTGAITNTQEFDVYIIEENKIYDGIGDCVVVLTNLAKLCGTRIEDCTRMAYREISTRKGRMQNGTFVKDE